MRGRLYSSCVLHESEKWSIKQAEMIMIRWLCDVKVKDRVPSKEMRETRNFGTVAKRLHWYGYVLRKEDYN